MVSTEMKKSIQREFRELSNSRINLESYSDEAFAVAFEILSADTFIAGLASKLVDGGRIANRERAALRDNLMSGKSWRRQNGELFDLLQLPELLDLAMQIDNLRKKMHEL